MNTKAEKKVILIFGKRGSGKSYLANKLIENTKQLLIYDTLCEYTNGVVFDTEHREDFLRFWGERYRRPYRLIYQPLNPDQEIEEIAELVFAIGNITFLVEEIDCYCSSFQIDPSFAHIVQRGRHKNITLIGVTQRPYGINRLLTSQAKEIFIFNTNEPRDREYLKNLLGQDVESKLDQLGKFQYLQWRDDVEGLEIGKA